MSGGSQKYNIITVMNKAAQSHIVANLKKYTKYEFFIAPFYKTVEGQPSNSKMAQTFEDGKQSSGHCEGMTFADKHETIFTNLIAFSF